MNPRICPFVFNGFIKPAIFQQLIEFLLSIAKIRKLKSGLCYPYNCIYKTEVLLWKAEVMLGANIVWIAWGSYLLVNLKPVIYQPKDKKQMNPRLCPLILNGFIKPSTFQQLIECLVSMAKERKLKYGLYRI